jgi:hypothetical protein
MREELNVAKRFVVEATWEGYTSSQAHVCHRSVETYWRAGYEAIRWHQFGDGTGMSVHVRDAKPRERVEQKLGYSKLLRDLAFQEYEKISASQASGGADGG